jgi:hydrogenase maturation protease
LKILVLGLGNDFYGDDGVGLEVVRRLKKEWAAAQPRPAEACRVEFAESLLTGIALLDVIVGYDALVIVDTIFKPDPVIGRVRFLEAKDVRDIPGPSPHYVSIPQTLTIGRQLGLKMPGVVKIIAVEAKPLYHLNEDLSEDMKRRLPDIIATTKDVVSNLDALSD